MAVGVGGELRRCDGSAEQRGEGGRTQVVRKQVRYLADDSVAGIGGRF